MKEATHQRKGKTISPLDGGESTTFKTMNAAKRASRKLQLDADGASGRGISVSVK